MSDLTLLYYTANRIAPSFAVAVMQELRKATDLPVVAVAHGSNGVYPPIKPMLHPAHFINVGECEPSIWRVYVNVLVAAKVAETPFVACVEDDSIYTPEHFAFRPPLDTFAYNLNRWVITRRLSDDGKSRHAFYYWRKRTQMAQCIAPRELLIETLTKRFEKYPTPVPHEIAKKSGWGEPGRYEKNLGLPRVKLEHFHTAQPNVTFNHGESLMGRRRVNPDDRIEQSIEPWGEANALWNRIHGN